MADFVTSSRRGDRGFVIGSDILRDGCGLAKLLDFGPWLYEFIKYLSVPS